MATSNSDNGIFCASAAEADRSRLLQCCQKVDGSPCALCREHIDLDAQLIIAQRAVEQLLERRRSVRTRINLNHDSATTNLPNELIGRIFEFSLSERWDYGPWNAWGERVEAATAEGPRPDLGKSKEMCMDVSPLFFGSICMAWRRIAWSTPSLWTTVRVSFFEGEDGPAPMPADVLSGWLERSGQLHLSIYLLGKYPNGGPRTARGTLWTRNDLLSDFGNVEVNRDLAALINRHSDRWEHLHVVGLHHTIATLLGTASAPQLRTLCVKDVPKSTRALFENVVGAELRPSSITLIYCLGLKTPCIQWNHVTDLSVKGYGVEMGLTLLQLATQLVRFKWNLEISRLNRGERMPSTATNPQTIVHHALHTLEICTSEKYSLMDVPPALALLFCKFDFPNLTKCSIEDGRHESFWDSFLDHIRRSSSPLTSLTIHCSQINCWSLIDILEETSSLRKLQLTMQNTMGNDSTLEFLRLISSTSIYDTTLFSTAGASQRHFLPELEILEFGKLGTYADKKTENEYWECIANLCGDVSRIHDPKRRPLNKLRINWRARLPKSEKRDPETFNERAVIEKQSLVRLLELAEAGVTLDLRDSSLQFDLLEMSKKYHGIASS